MTKMLAIAGMIAAMTHITSATAASASSDAVKTRRSCPLAGTWTLVAADKELSDGTRARDYGTAPTGMLMIDAECRYSLQISSTNVRPSRQATRRRAPTPSFERPCWAQAPPLRLARGGRGGRIPGVQDRGLILSELEGHATEADLYAGQGRSEVPGSTSPRRKHSHLHLAASEMKAPLQSLWSGFWRHQVSAPAARSRRHCVRVWRCSNVRLRKGTLHRGRHFRVRSSLQMLRRST